MTKNVNNPLDNLQMGKRRTLVPVLLLLESKCSPRCFCQAGDKAAPVYFHKETHAEMWMANSKTIGDVSHHPHGAQDHLDQQAHVHQEQVGQGVFL